MTSDRRIKVAPLLLFLFSLYIYPVMIKGPALLSYTYIYLLPAVYLVANYRSTAALTKWQTGVLVVAGVLFVLSFLYPVLHGTFDLSYVVVTTYIFRKLVVYVFLAHLLVRHYGEKTSIGHFMYYFALVQAAYVVGTMLMVALPELRQLWFSVFDEVTSSAPFAGVWGYTFRIGWQGFSGFGYTIFCSLSCIFLMYLRYGDDKGVQLSTTQFIVPFVLSILGNMFYGRSGLVVSMGACAVGLVVWNRRRPLNIVKMGLFVAALLLGLYAIRNIPALSSWYYWMSMPIANLMTSGDFNNASIEATRNMVFMPEASTILLGDGLYTQDGHYYMYTDSGIMRTILFWGMLGFTLSYGMVFCILAQTRKFSWLFFVLLLGALAAFEYKGHMYYDFASLVLAFSFIDSMKQHFVTRGVWYGPPSERCMQRI